MLFRNSDVVPFLLGENAAPSSFFVAHVLCSLFSRREPSKTFVLLVLSGKSKQKTLCKPLLHVNSTRWQASEFAEYLLFCFVVLFRRLVDGMVCAAPFFGGFGEFSKVIEEAAGGDIF